MKDKTGREIKAGDVIAYVIQCGHGDLKIGKVLAVKRVNTGYGDKKMSVVVRGIDDGWGGQPAKLCSKSGNLLYGSRIIVLRGVLPENYQALLNQIKAPQDEQNYEKESVLA